MELSRQSVGSLYAEDPGGDARNPGRNGDRHLRDFAIEVGQDGDADHGKHQGPAEKIDQDVTKGS